jgi:hypothetical protein
LEWTDINSQIYTYDGVFTGPDEEGFIARYESERTGEQQEAKSVLSWISEGVGVDEIVRRLARHAEAGASQDGVDRNSLTRSARGREAMRLQEVIQVSGPEALKQLATRIVSYQLPALIKL